MDTIIVNCGNSRTFDPHRLLPNLSDKMKLRRSEKYVVFIKLSMYYLWENMKKSHESNNIKIFSPKWNGKTELSNGPYSVLDIQVYVKYIIKNI